MPNFTALDMSLPEVANLVAAMIGGECGSKVAALLGRMILNLDVGPVDITEFVQCLLEGLNNVR